MRVVRTIASVIYSVVGTLAFMLLFGLGVSLVVWIIVSLIQGWLRDAPGG